MNENPYESPEGDSAKPRTARHNIAVPIVLVLVVVCAFCLTPADPITMLVFGPIIAGLLFGVYALGVWSG
ncbi:MAG: hypothetical protein RIC55_02955 [Pirellulaceae bacterium]